MPGSAAGPPRPAGSIAHRLAARLCAIGDGLPVADLRAAADALAAVAGELYAVGTTAEPVARAAHTLTGAHTSISAAARALDQAHARLNAYATRALGIPAGSVDGNSTRTVRVEVPSTPETTSRTEADGSP